MAYATAGQVASICRNLLDGQSEFTTSTSPSLMDVNYYLSSGCSIIDVQLANLGWAVPVPSSASTYDMLSNLNMLYAAAMCELTRINTTLGPGERTRGQLFEGMFWAGLKRMETTDFSSMGLTADAGGAVMYVGGVSEADHDLWEDDDDRRTPRFTRDQFGFS